MRNQEKIELRELFIDAYGEKRVKELEEGGLWRKPEFADSVKEIVQQTTLRIYTPEQLHNKVNQMPQVNDYIEQLLAPEQIMLVAGERGKAKTYEMQHLTFILCSGGKWHGLDVSCVPVLYIGFEGSKRKLDERIKKLESLYPNVKHQPLLMFRHERIELDTSEGYNYMDKILSVYPNVAVAILDPVVFTTHGKLSDPETFKHWYDGVSSLASKHSVAFIFTTNERKVVYNRDGTEDLFSMDRIKGAGDLPDRADTVMMIVDEKAPRYVSGKSKRVTVKTYLTIPKARESDLHGVSIEVKYNKTKEMYESKRDFGNILGKSRLKSSRILG